VIFQQVVHSIKTGEAVCGDQAARLTIHSRGQLVRRVLDEGCTLQQATSIIVI
jgi:hypothetical protein